MAFDNVINKSATAEMTKDPTVFDYSIKLEEGLPIHSLNTLLLPLNATERTISINPSG